MKLGIGRIDSALEDRESPQSCRIVTSGVPMFRTDFFLLRKRRQLVSIGIHGRHVHHSATVNRILPAVKGETSCRIRTMHLVPYTSDIEHLWMS